MATPKGKKPRKRLKSNTDILVLGLFVIVVFFLCIGLLMLFLPSGENTAEVFPGESPEERRCPIYGCHVEPLEMDSEIVLDALEDLKDDPFSAPDFAQFLGTTVTYQSNEHHYNQDRAVIIRPYKTHQSEQYGEEESFLLGIFDGHGEEGHAVAEYASRELPRLLAAKLDARMCCQNDEWIIQQLNQTFVEVNEEAPPSAMRGGCTASVTLRIGSKVYFANAGDSRTILVSAEKEEAEILYETRRDKANLPDEKARIEALGGKIHIPPQNPNLSRVIVYSTAARPPEPIGLAMSRSIGDWEWKIVGVTAEPIVDVIDLTGKEDTFVLSASDGLWDLRRKEFFAKRFAKALREGTNLLQSSVDIIQLVSPNKGYRDDISLILAPTTHGSNDEEAAVPS